MRKMEFKAIGRFKEKRGEKKFTKTISAESEKRAREKIFCLLGSEHGTKRRHIKIEKLEEVKQNA